MATGIRLRQPSPSPLCNSTPEDRQSVPESYSHPSPTIHVQLAIYLIVSPRLHTHRVVDNLLYQTQEVKTKTHTS